MDEREQAERVLARIVVGTRRRGLTRKTRQAWLGAEFTDAVQRSAVSGAAWAVHLRSLASLRGVSDWSLVLWSSRLDRK